MKKYLRKHLQEEINLPPKNKNTFTSVPKEKWGNFLDGSEVSDASRRYFFVNNYDFIFDSNRGLIIALLPRANKYEATIFHTKSLLSIDKDLPVKKVSRKKEYDKEDLHKVFELAEFFLSKINLKKHNTEATKELQKLVKTSGMSIKEFIKKKQEDFGIETY